jgi:tetratricopeptide (TPR) repeat protein
MRNFKIYLLGVAAMLFSTSCLDKDPTHAILADQSITTVEEANQAVMGIYSDFMSRYLYSGNLTLLPDIQSDLVYAVNGYSNTYGDIWRWNINPTNADIEAVYGSLYKVIGDCNFFFEQVAKWENNIVDDDAYEKLEAYKGEVYFARALAYSELIKCFCKAYDPDTAKDELGVVLVSSYSNPGEMKRVSLYDSYQFVLNDLAKAYDYMEPEEGTTLVASDYYDSPYFNEFTVQALMARIYLYMQDWDNAIKYSSKLIDSDLYLLSSATTVYTNDDYMWKYDASTETIWKVGFLPTSYGGKLGQVFLNFDEISYRPDYVPGQAALNTYEGNDLRYVSFFQDMPTGYAHGLVWPLLVKYYGNMEFVSNYRIYHVNMPKVFRLSEQYLIRAEAYCQKEDFAKASADISTLRQARYQTYGSATLTSENWLDEIDKERLRELFMEGFRLQDLKRWGKGFERKPQEQSVRDGSSLKIEAGNPLFVWPIPQHELDLPGSAIEPNESNK